MPSVAEQKPFSAAPLIGPHCPPAGRPPCAPARWVHAVPHLDPKYGGLSAVVPALSSSLAETGSCSVSLAAFCRTGEYFTPPLAAGVSPRYFPLGWTAWLSHRRTRDDFRQVVREATGVHIHGLWQMSTAVAARAAQACNKPYLISAHGMLESWALANKKVKKAMYATLFERSNLRSATCLHALTAAEARDYRRFGLPNPIAVIPNGVAIPPDSSPEPFLRRFPGLRRKRLVLFLSRLHAKKGLDLLTQAWSDVSRRWPEAQLVLAGPDFEGTQARIESQLEGLGIRHRVTFTGMLSGDLKWSALASAECFVLPSYSEGLSVSVLEAMGMGLPVVITRQCNLPEVSDFDCGWTIEPDSGQLASALRSLLSAPDRERSSFGKNGQRLVADRYSWPVIGKQMAAVYRWLAGGCAPHTINLQEGKKS